MRGAGDLMSKTTKVGLFFRDDIAKSAQTADTIMKASYAGHDVEFSIGDAEGLDLAISIGGDGTFLRTAQMIRQFDVPLYGVHTGRLGFLVPGDHRRAPDDLQKILDGRYSIETRSTLIGSLRRGGAEIGRVSCLNEVALLKDQPTRPIEVSVGVAGEEIFRALVDGVLAATPTGTTAYALSAGGPIVSPDLECVVLVPVCPHSLNLRPLVLGLRHEIEMHIISGGDRTTLSGDGQRDLKTEDGDTVVVSADDHPLRAIKLVDVSFPSVLKQKFRWGADDQGDA